MGKTCLNLISRTQLIFSYKLPVESKIRREWEKKLLDKTINSNFLTAQNEARSSLYLNEAITFIIPIKNLCFEYFLLLTEKSKSNESK